jgi:hypothetical protein
MRKWYANATRHANPCRFIYNRTLSRNLICTANNNSESTRRTRPDIPTEPAPSVHTPALHFCLFGARNGCRKQDPYTYITATMIVRESPKAKGASSNPPHADPH